jgi:hypothetical protein
MSSTTRQNNLLLSEDWKKIYQTFTNADFTSYDFENLRRTMIDYIRVNFPEDFNDYIESSEYLALIDLIAFVGQSIAFRVDLNARENFIETAERRSSLLNLSQLVSYVPSRSTSASGLLKFGTISTTENVVDSNNRNLSGQVIGWNDASNINWYDQFIRVINAAFPQTQQFGSPSDQSVIYNIPTAQYRFNATNSTLPIYSFTSTVAGRSMNFEVVSTTFKGEAFIYEETPKVGNAIACVYADDGYGAGSPGTGFFFRFVQGTLNQGTFTISNPTANETVTINTQNVNNSDVWLWQLDQASAESMLWTKVPALTGNNIIYNNLNQNINTVYAVTTQVGDAISLNFADGVFGKIPLGSFKTYYRISNNLTYTVNPTDINNISISIPYTSASGGAEVITITLTLETSASNATATESNASIKQNAPQTYYTQNRMITGEDYNISPLSASLQVAKVKAINRTSSGISRYFDLNDPTGKYSSTNLFADDGVIYRQDYTSGTTFTYLTTTDIQGVLDNVVTPILEDPNLRNFFYQNFISYITTSLNVAWYSITTDSNSGTGYVGGTTGATPYPVGSYTLTDLLYVTVGSLIKFAAPTGYYFNTIKNNELTAYTGSVPVNGASYMWASVISIIGDGTASGVGKLSTGFGPITLSKAIPNLVTKTGVVAPILTQIVPQFSTTLTSSVKAQMIDLISANSAFGLRYDAPTQSWQIIYSSNVNSSGNFSLNYQGNNANAQLDSSWFLLFTTNTQTYTITQRSTRYIFESDKEVIFYFDTTNKIYDKVSSKTIVDYIKILNVNTQPGLTSNFTTDLQWEIVSEYVGNDGYIDPKKIVITFADPFNTGVVDNPQLFLDFVAPTTAPLENKFIVQKKYTIAVGQEDYRYVYNNPTTGPVVILATEGLIYPLTKWNDGQYFYFIDTQTVVQYFASTGSYSPTLDYRVYSGRDKIRFQYTHSADYNSRIDPSSSNIIDVYILTNSYDTAYRQWIVTKGSKTEPLPPSSDELNNLLSGKLDLIKSISDEVIYHPVNYVLLFGKQADPSLQATFEVMINPSSTVSNANIQARILTAINQFFALENWNFGDTFYFTELSTYVMQQLSPDIISLVIVPNQTGQYFGSLFEIKCPSNGIFLSCATTTDIVVVAGLTNTNLKTVTGTGLASLVTSQQITSANYGANS